MSADLFSLLAATAPMEWPEACVGIAFYATIAATFWAYAYSEKGGKQ